VLGVLGVSGLLRTVAACALIGAASFVGGWLYRAHFDAQATAAALAAANARTAAAVAQWRAAADRAESAYLAQKDQADAATAALQAQIDAQQGGNAPLSPYLSHAARLVFPAHGTGVPAP
jgi:hypothetical protein